MFSKEQKEAFTKFLRGVDWVVWVVSCFISWKWVIGMVIASFWEDAFSQETGIILAAFGFAVLIIFMPASAVYGRAVFRQIQSSFRWIILPVSLGPPAIPCGLVTYLAATQ
jgi:hypothetical protein